MPPPAAGEPRIDSLPSTLAHLASAAIALDRPADPIRPDRRTAPLVRRALACVVAFAKTLGKIRSQIISVGAHGGSGPAAGRGYPRRAGQGGRAARHSGSIARPGDRGGAGRGGGGLRLWRRPGRGRAGCVGRARGWTRRWGYARRGLVRGRRRRRNGSGPNAGPRLQRANPRCTRTGSNRAAQARARPKLQEAVRRDGAGRAAGRGIRRRRAGVGARRL